MKRKLMLLLACLFVGIGLVTAQTQKVTGVVISEEDAKNIVSFVKKWYNKVDTIIVHCNAGISRSSGVCAAIMKGMTGDDSQIFDNPKYVPNTTCYKVVLEEFMKEKE